MYVLRSANFLPKIRIAIFAAAGWLTIFCYALGPHEVVLLVNENSPQSLEIANHYVHLRKIPAQNVIHLSLPQHVFAAKCEFTPNEFTQYIWEPIQKKIHERRIGDHILAWVFSVDFPIRITSNPPVSLQGLVFVKNNLPLSDEIQKGLYASRLFAGPDKPNRPGAPSHSFENFTQYLLTNMPIPSMMLGYVGARGITLDETLKTLNYGVISDRTQPKGPVYFVENNDVRSTTRSWQYPSVQKELSERGVTSVITSNPPPISTPLMGVMTGNAWTDIPKQSAFLPGGMADHLTSFGAVFHTSEQTPMTDWLKAGATASAGTITEPYSVWTKFPHARFFTHYAHGCTLIESFYQAIRCPLQILLVGEPLAAPWSNAQPLTLINVDDDKNLKGTTSFFASPWGLDRPEMIFLLDGLTLNHAANHYEVKLDTTKLNDGYHELRAVAYTKGNVRHQSFAELGFTINNKGRFVQFAGITNRMIFDLDHPVRLQTQFADQPQEIALIAQEQVVAVTKDLKNGGLLFHPSAIGLGPNLLQVEARYADNETVRSAPLSVEIKHLNQPPHIERITAETVSNGETRLTVHVVDTENDPILIDWLQTLCSNTTTSLSTPNQYVTKIVDEKTTQPRSEYGAEILLPPAPSRIDGRIAGLIFNVKDSENFSCFAFFGNMSSWAFGTCVDSKFTHTETYGSFAKLQQWQQILLYENPTNGLEAWVNHQRICTDKKLRLGDGAIGLIGAKESTEFRELVAAPFIPTDDIKTENGNLIISAPTTHMQTFFTVRARDHRLSETRRFQLSDVYSAANQ